MSSLGLHKENKKEEKEEKKGSERKPDVQPIHKNESNVSHVGRLAALPFKYIIIRKEWMGMHVVPHLAGQAYRSVAYSTSQGYAHPQRTDKDVLEVNWMANSFLLSSHNLRITKEEKGIGWPSVSLTSRQGKSRFILILRSQENKSLRFPNTVHFFWMSFNPWSCHTKSL
jgi:hypothetical protein